MVLEHLKKLWNRHLNVYEKKEAANLTVAQEITLDLQGRTVLEIYTSSTVATTFRLDVSMDGTTWITDYATWTGVNSVKETWTIGFRYVKLKSDAAGVAGDVVDLVLSAGGV